MGGAGRGNHRRVAPPPRPVGSCHRTLLVGDPGERAGRDARPCLAGRGAEGFLRRISGVTRRRAISCCRVCRWARSFTTAWASGSSDQGVKVHLGTPVRHIEGDRRRASAIVLADGTRREFDGLIVAVPWRNVKSLFADDLLAAMPALGRRRADRAGGDHGRSPLVRPPDHTAASCRPGRPAESMGVCEPMWCRRRACKCDAGETLHHNSIAKS